MLLRTPQMILFRLREIKYASCMLSTLGKVSWKEIVVSRLGPKQTKVTGMLCHKMHSLIVRC